MRQYLLQNTGVLSLALLDCLVPGNHVLYTEATIIYLYVCNNVKGNCIVSIIMLFYNHHYVILSSLYKYELLIRKDFYNISFFCFAHTTNCISDVEKALVSYLLQLGRPKVAPSQNLLLQFKRLNIAQKLVTVMLLMSNQVFSIDL